MLRLAAGALVLLALAVPARAACPDRAEVARFAAALIERRSPPPYQGLSVEEARCAQERLVALLAQPWGDAVGYKLGLTNPAVQRRFGLSEPVRGTIFFGTLRAPSGSEIEARFGAVPAVEADLLVRVGRDGVEAAGEDHVAILRHLDQVIPFLELPDLVFPPDRPPDLPNILAANVGARLGVVGAPVPVEPTAEFAARLGAMRVTLSDGERELASAPGSAILGHPLNAVAWLARDLAREGRRLRAGEYVSLGSFSPPVPAEAGKTYTVRYEGLGPGPVEVSVRLR